MKAIACAAAVISCLFASWALAQPKQTCFVQDLQCQVPGDGPYILVTAKVFPEGFGVEVSVLGGKWELDSALGFAESYAQEVMALKGWCMKGYSTQRITGNDQVGRRIVLLCKQ